MLEQLAHKHLIQGKLGEKLDTSCILLCNLIVIFMNLKTKPKIIMEEYSYDSGVAGGILGAFGFVYFAIILLIIISMWKIFTKAGKPGWAAIIPIYNIIVLLEIVGKPVWWIILLLIPFVNFFVMLYVAHLLSKSFGKDIVMTILLIILPFVGYPMLAFGDARYVGPPKD